ncbi:MAG: hypothetical protein R3D58_04705 [Saprospiraceae bacterium]
MTHWIKKWTVWEYLPWWLANVPVYAFYSWFALRARHLFFFSNVNPAIPLGGAVGESKHDILKLVPESVKPKTVFVLPEMSFEAVITAMQTAGLNFPVVAKPDVGERGFLVQKFTAAGPLRQHLERYPVPFLIQEFLTHPLELSVLFHRFPDNGRFGLSSICIKEFLSVTGDGQSSVRRLMAIRPRAAFQLERFEQENPGLLEHIPGPGETLLLEPIGNHIRGTKFLNGNHLIEPGLEAVFEQVCRQIDGVFYGRFDLKCASVDALRQGAFQVMELNGILAEPAHVYDPAYGMWRAYRDFFRHWSLLFDLHRAQRRCGIPPASHRAAWQFVRRYFRYKKDLESR